MECMCAQSRPLLILSSERVFAEWSQNPMLTPKDKITSTGKILLRGGWNPRCCIKQDSEPNTLPMSYTSPRVSGDAGILTETVCCLGFFGSGSGLIHHESSIYWHRCDGRGCAVCRHYWLLAYARADLKLSTVF